jgi:hypothetical protein
LKAFSDVPFYSRAIQGLLRMARYYFHIRDNAALITDDEGLELSDIGAARAEALLSVNDLVLENLRCGRILSTSVEITDFDGKMLDEMRVNSTIH